MLSIIDIDKTDEQGISYCDIDQPLMQRLLSAEDVFVGVNPSWTLAYVGTKAEMEEVFEDNTENYVAVAKFVNFRVHKQTLN